MKTTMNIPDELMRKAVKAAGAKTKTETVILALEELIRRRRVETLLKRAGTLDFASDDEFERMRHER